LESDCVFDNEEDGWKFARENFTLIRKVDGKTDSRYVFGRGRMGLLWDDWTQEGKALKAKGKWKLAKIETDILIPDSGVTIEIVSKDKDLKYKVVYDDF